MKVENFNEDPYANGSGGSLSEINVTPLVDVMLVLLIIFMVTAPLMQHGVKINLPRANTEEMKTTDTSLVLTITKEKELFINKNPVPLSNLSEKIKAIYEHKKSKDIFIKADQNVSYGFVISIMADLKKAGLNRIGLVTLPR